MCLLRLLLAAVLKVFMQLILYKQVEKHGQKVYVDSHRIKAVSQGIIVTYGKHAFLVKAIRRDQKGLFFLKKDRVVEVAKGKKTDKDEDYVCDECGRTFKTLERLLWHQLGHKQNTDVYDD
jgi:predicted transcriptional regulator